MRKPPRETRTALHAEPRTAVHDDGRLWLWLGQGPLVEHLAHEFVRMFPSAECEIDEILDDVWLFEPDMASDAYAHLGVKVSVEWFRRK